MPTLEAYQGVYLWNYVPSFAAGVTFAALFAALTAAHSWRMLRHKSWFCVIFIVGGIFEIIGYASRAAAYDHTGSLALYLVQAIALVVPPIFFAASLYITYGHLVDAVDGSYFSPLTPERTTLIYVIGDLFCLTVQGNGAGLLAHQHIAHIGEIIVIVGLILQILMFASFMYCCLVFHKRFGKYIVENSYTCSIPWKVCINMLYGTSSMIIARNIYRVVEFIMGNDGYLLEREWPIYVFDGGLMLVVMVLFFYWYPPSLLSQTSSIGRKERITRNST